MITACVMSIAGIMPGGSIPAHVALADALTAIPREDFDHWSQVLASHYPRQIGINHQAGRKNDG